MPLLTGCEDATKWNLEVVTKTTNAVRVDLVGVNHAERKEWQNLSVDDYWRPDNSFRSNLVKITIEAADGKISIPEGHGSEAGAEKSLVTGVGTDTVVIPTTHPMWRTWLSKPRNAHALVAIGRFTTYEGKAPRDPRKQVICLFKQYWDTSKRTLRVEIRDDHLQVVTSPSPKAAKLDQKYGF